MKIDYLIIYHEDGTPVYSKCFSSFCVNLGLDENLLSGFLSALSTMPKEVFSNPDDPDEEISLDTVDMGKLQLHFKHTTPTGYVICTGVNKKSLDNPLLEEMMNSINSQIESLLEDDFSDVNWVMCSDEDKENFEEKLLYDILEPTLDYFTERCSCGDTCGVTGTQRITSDDVVDTSEPVWDRLEQSIRAKTNYGIFTPIVKFIIKIYGKIYGYFDERSYSKAMKKQQKEQQVIQNKHKEQSEQEIQQSSQEESEPKIPESTIVES